MSANNFAIIRATKITNRSHLKKASDHNNRSQKPENAAPDADSPELVAGGNDALDRLDKVLSKTNIKPRKNAVLAVEYMMSYSPEMEGKVSVDKWKHDNIDFLNNKYGKGRILSAHVHTDETTTHMHVIMAPIVKKMVRGKEKYRLSARDWLGGKKEYYALQDEYAKAMEPHQLQRGIRNSRAKHQDLKTFYGKLNTEIQQLEDAVSRELANQPEQPHMFGWKAAYQQLRSLFEDYIKQTSRLLLKNKRLTRDVKRLRPIERRLTELETQLHQASGGQDTEAVLNTLQADRNKREAKAAREASKAAQEYNTTPPVPSRQDREVDNVKPDSELSRPTSPRKTIQRRPSLSGL